MSCEGGVGVVRGVGVTIIINIMPLLALLHNVIVALFD